MNYIITGSNISDILTAVNNGCYGIYYKIHDNGKDICLYMLLEKLKDIITISGKLPIFVEPVEPFTDNLYKFLIQNKNSLNVVSSNKEFLANLYIKCPGILLGFIEKTHDNMLQLNSNEHFLDFVVLNYSNSVFTRIEQIRNKFPDIHIYVYDVIDSYHIRKCFNWQIKGVIMESHRIKNLKKVIDEMTSSTNRIIYKF